MDELIDKAALDKIGALQGKDFRKNFILLAEAAVESNAEDADITFTWDIGDARFCATLSLNVFARDPKSARPKAINN